VTQHDWNILTTQIQGLGLAVLGIDQRTGIIVVKVPKLKK